MSPRIAIRFLSDVRSDCRATKGSTWADALFYRVESINRWFVLAVLLALWASGTSAASTPTLDVAQALDDPYLARQRVGAGAGRCIAHQLVPVRMVGAAAVHQFRRPDGVMHS